MSKLQYLTLSEFYELEIPKIKGSRFITSLFPLTSREEVETHLMTVREKYRGATHYCYAYRFQVQALTDLFWHSVLEAKHERSNDDGEPANTAWKPMLTVLKWTEVFDVLVVVTRYFWGTLLGVWGLIQAYTQATKEALQKAPLVYKELTKTLYLIYGYDKVSDVQYLLNKYEGRVLSSQYGVEIQQTIAINVAFYQEIMQILQEYLITFQEG